ncbi:helix-turn-helix and ligand-binding sensor domain-containing protein [Empedobacter falsenii]|uniref:helix-turn-helix and ligand-binding sensor domain-containing protein n=1 Tax=Empedobacter falsenii TaxID=343874 RepID=UPI001C8DBF2E|nr:hypothetical protein [Empedobacter falsenii]MBY0066537.1 hypothetical protein [Empedobacter falsenii]
MRSLFILFLLVSIYSKSQSFAPIISNYSKSEYLGESPIWDITENQKQGKVYFANNRNILEYDGNFWEKYSPNSLTIIRSVFTMNNVLYSGALNNFGYWKTIEGKKVYISISDKFKSFEGLEQEEIWKIFYHNRSIYFQSFNYLFQFDGKTVKRYKLPALSSYVYLVKGKMLVATISKGIFEFNNGHFEPLFEIEKGKSIVIHGIEKYDNDYLVGTLTEGIFKYNKTAGLQEFNVEFNKMLKNYLVLKMIRLEDKLIIGTSNNGIYVYDLKTNSYKNYNQNSGLISNTIQNIRIDSKGNAWLGTDKGISKIELKNKTQLLYDYNGHLGNVFSFDFYKDNILLGTNHGFYNYSNTSNQTNSVLEKGLIWNVTNIDNTIYVSDSWGTYIYSGLLNKISSTNGGFKLIKNGNKLYQSSFTGINEYIQGSHKESTKVSSLTIPIIDFVIVENKILGTGKNGGLYLFDLKNRTGKEIFYQHKKLVNPQTILEDNKVFVLIDDQHLVRYDINKNLFSDENLDSKLKNINRIRYLKENRYLVEADNILYYSKVEQNKLIHYLIPKKLYDGKLVDDNLTAKINDQFLYINLENGLLKYDLKSIRRELPKIKIKAKINQTVLNNEPNIEYSNNYIDFYVSIVNDDFANYQLYYQLNNSKIQPLNQPIINYKQLESGSYQLSIYALKDGNFVELNHFDFRVKKIWYLSNLMILFYILLIVGSILAIYKYNRMKLKQSFRIKQKQFEYELNLMEMKHQQELKELNHHKEKQHLETSLQTKSTELAGQALKLANQRAMILEINQLFSQLEMNEINKKLKKKFEKTFSEYSYNRNEWQNFELNIQEIHQDFIKRLADKYSNLTAKDLKLCVFLRMNLSTKEIAPLMHLNYRSVELQRYRLRKKMQIPSEINLNKYMINF